MLTGISRFFIFVLIVSIIVTVGGMAAFVFLIPEHYSVLYPASLILVAFITVVSFIILAKYASRKPQSFVNTFMLATTVKLFVYLMFLAPAIYFNRGIAIPVAVTFFGLYIIFSVLEVVYILKYLKKNSL